MKKYTLREIKRFVSLGLAQDITTASRPAIHEPFEKSVIPLVFMALTAACFRARAAAQFTQSQPETATCFIISNH